MAQQPDDDTEKSHEATPQKILDARKKGEVVRSADLVAAAGYGGILLAGLAIGAATVDATGSAMMVLVEQSDRLADLVFAGSGGAALSGAMGSIAMALLGWYLIPAGLALLAVLGQRSLVFAGEKLQPKLSRINPIENAKNKYGPSGLFEFFKSFAKLFVFAICLTVFIKAELPQIMMTSSLEPQLSTAYLGKLFLGFLAIVICVSAVIGGLDYAFQYFEHRRKLSMGRTAVQDETKEQEDDPYMKNQREQRGREMAMSHTLKDVETADVVITNPTHYAVALHWSRAPGEAPTCVAKGTDEFARAIRERATEHGVPLHEDPPTARALHATVEIGQEIPPELYQAVATAVRFAEAMRQRVRNQVY